MFVRALKDLWETASSVLPLMGVLIVFQLGVLRKPIPNAKVFIIACFLCLFGLHFFIKGASNALIPLADTVGSNIVSINNNYIIIGFALLLGYASTLVEPALAALAIEVEEISVGAIRRNVLTHTVAIGFGIGLAIGISKILFNISTKKILLPLLLISGILAYFAPEEYVAIAFDSASATTGPVNIPINMALAIGIAKTLEGVDPLLSGFGIVGLTSMGTVLSVLTLGILNK
ncbi:MAG: DUF1538 domain-containing protein [Caldicoprobacterales bacterium]|nr:DUF1538 domain-containing protein [Clostridiales bacterium]